MKNILFLMRQAPYSGAQPLEAVELALVAGVFEQSVSVLFRGEGVWQLVKNQDGAPLGVRTLGKVLSVLPEYDITAVYVCAPSLAQRKLCEQDLLLPVTVLDFEAQCRLLAGQDVVVND